MKNGFKDTLVLALEEGHLARPKPGSLWGFFNAQTLPLSNSVSIGLISQLVCEQGFRPEFLALDGKGYQVVPSFSSELSVDASIILTSRVRQTNETNFHRAWNATKENGLIFIAGEKNTGIGSFRKWVSGICPVIDSLSKFHAVCFWVKKFGQSAPEPISLVEDRRAGLFSAGEPDKGSVLLAETFDRRIKGKVADFGAGWGYLSNELLLRSNRVDQLDLYEADWNSLEFAKAELADHDQTGIGFHWIDLQGEFRKKPYEWIIMNPPFHHGLFGSRMADPSLGKSFIQIAASSLVSGGKLLMVANRNLPYEETLEKTFRRSSKLVDQDGYKVIEAIK